MNGIPKQWSHCALKSTETVGFIRCGALPLGDGRRPQGWNECSNQGG
jgi:hypothetical protein